MQATAFIDEARAAELRRALIAMVEPAMASLARSVD
jgi:FMN-dependent NADH-azoreductase